MDFDFKKELKEVGLSKKKFSKQTGISYDTIVGWTKGKKEKIPSWVSSWLENYKAKLELEKLKEVFKKEERKS